MRYRLLYLATGLIGALFATVMPLPVAAVDAESITLSPGARQYALDAGTTKRDSFKVLNDGNTDYRFVVYTAPYSVKNSQYVPDYTTLSERADAYSWVQFDKIAWDIKAGQLLEIPFTLRVPSDAAPGGHYGVLFAEVQPKDAEDGFTVARKKRVGMIIYVTANGDVIRKGQELTTRFDFFQFSAPLVGTTSVDSTGNTDYKMTSHFRVSTVLGGSVYQRKAEHIILPKTTRDLEFKWEGAPWIGLYRVSVTTDILGSTHTSEQWVLLAPKWFYLVTVVIVGGGVYAALRQRRTRK